MIPQIRQLIKRTKQIRIIWNSGCFLIEEKDWKGLYNVRRFVITREIASVQLRKKDVIITYKQGGVVKVAFPEKEAKASRSFFYELRDILYHEPVL